ncbi:hypothetical protein ACVIHI_005793 [Bradyrhizobium sp. USDA 4524]
MIQKSGNRFSLATNAERVCAEIMLKQRDWIVMRFCGIASRSSQSLAHVVAHLFAERLAAGGAIPDRNVVAIEHVELL